MVLNCCTFIHRANQILFDHIKHFKEVPINIFYPHLLTCAYIKVKVHFSEEQFKGFMPGGLLYHGGERFRPYRCRMPYMDVGYYDYLRHVSPFVL